MPVTALKTIAKSLLAGTALYERLAGFRRRHIGYSQFGEDIHIQGFYDRLKHDRNIDVKHGCIVDIGAFRPIVFSNSYLLHEQGWRSINIDPTPGSMILFNKIRPRDANLEIAIGPENTTGTFYLFGKPSVWNTMDKASATIAEAKTRLAPKEIQIPIRRLETILDEHLGEDAFELLSIDAEGFDLEVLKSNDFSKYRPRLILIEAHDVKINEIGRHPIVRFLGDQDYQLHSWINPNLLFIRGDSLLKAEDKPA
jgi:FkbM family methyltransferase